MTTKTFFTFLDETRQRSLLDMDEQQLADFLAELGEPKFRAARPGNGSTNATLATCGNEQPAQSPAPWLAEVATAAPLTLATEVVSCRPRHGQSASSSDGPDHRGRASCRRPAAYACISSQAVPWLYLLRHGTGRAGPAT